MPHHYLHRPLNFLLMPPLSCSSHPASLDGSHALVRESHTPLCGLRAATRSSSASFLPTHSLFKLLFSGLFYSCSCCCSLLLACFVDCCLQTFRCFDLIVKTFVSEFVLVYLFSAVSSLDYNSAF
jgi:hypothetical protein